MSKLISTMLVWLVRAYQLLLSPILPPCCRYLPTCSEYTVDAIRKHGAIKGGWLAVKRIGRCRPGCPGGHDPVP